MNRITFFFIYTLLITLFIPAIFTQVHLIFFAPFLILCYYYRSKISCLWLSLLCGLIIDLFSANTRLGVNALNYCLTTLILYSQTRHFYEDRLSTLPVMSVLFVVLSTSIQFILLYSIGKGFPIHWDLLKTDFILSPLYHALYCVVAFTIPCLFLPKPPKRQTVLFSPKGRI